MIEFAAITSMIIKHAPQAGQPIIKQAQKNEAVIKILHELKLNPTQIPDDVDTVYAHTLVRYGVFKPEAILNLFREKETKDSFWNAYTNNTPFEFVEYIRKFLKKDTDLDTNIRKANINISAELEKFGEVFISVAKDSASKKFLIPPEQTYPHWDLDVYPKEFKALISEKTRLFCGRKFVFQAIIDFVEKEKKGYFTVIGDAGMGKSAIAAQYVLATNFPCYFNVFAIGENKPEKFLASIRQQLIKRYSLQNADNADLRNLLQKVSEALNGQKLVIVVDALDEVEQEGNSNLLDLPQSLPDGVYFLLTRRPFNQASKRLTSSPDTPVDELDLTKGDYQKYSQEDIKEYLRSFLKMSKDEIRQWIQQLIKNPNSAKNTEEVIELNQWIEKQNPPIDQTEFVDKLAEKSQNNFMYLRYVLPAIATGKYNDLSLKGLPDGLKQYYITHWQRMGMDNDDNDINAKILFILLVRGEAVSSDTIADILDEDIFPIEKILGQWVEYITPRKVQEDKKEKTYYTIYHRSFFEFLQEQPKLDGNKNKRRFKEIKEKIYQYLNG
ncbi:AAA family ATPase [Tolypothrix sp. VBCCA 56010]|uniref:AAA family ATPase n=1 Tax=Tolypothrix sp. VBCCA 56010 TaxID=3137731 RepID=UPI003D7CE08C